MIPALLGGGEVGYTAAAVPLRAAHYAGNLGGAGLAFFALLFGRGLAAEDSARLCRWACRAAVLGVLAGVGVLAAQAGALAGGGTLLDAEVWGVVVWSRAGASYALGGLGLLLVALLALGPRWTAVAAAGGVLACASHLLLGHTTQAGPRPLLAGLLLVHLLVAAFWIGSLPPLAWAAAAKGRGRRVWLRTGRGSPPWPCRRWSRRGWCSRGRFWAGRGKRSCPGTAGRCWRRSPLWRCCWASPLGTAGA